MDNLFYCKACIKSFKSLSLVKRHIKTATHKKNVVIKFPESLHKKSVNGIPISTTRIDMAKISDYIIKNIPLIDIESESINGISKDKDLSKDMSKDISKNKPDFSIKMYSNEYYYLTTSEMVYLINIFAKYMKDNNIDPDAWFNYKYYLANKNVEEEITNTYIEIRDLLLDEYFVDSVVPALKVE